MKNQTYIIIACHPGFPDYYGRLEGHSIFQKFILTGLIDNATQFDSIFHAQEIVRRNEHQFSQTLEVQPYLETEKQEP